MGMRALNLETCLWSIYRINSTSGQLFSPVIGGFNGCHGLFFGDEIDDGLPVIARFEWQAHPQSPTLELIFLGWWCDMGSKLDNGTHQNLIQVEDAVNNLIWHRTRTSRT